MEEVVWNQVTSAQMTYPDVVAAQVSIRVRAAVRPERGNTVSSGEVEEKLAMRAPTDVRT